MRENSQLVKFVYLELVNLSLLEVVCAIAQHVLLGFAGVAVHLNEDVAVSSSTANISSPHRDLVRDSYTAHDHQRTTTALLRTGRRDATPVHNHSFQPYLPGGAIIHADLIHDSSSTPHSISQTAA